MRLYYNSSCLPFAASRPFTVSILRCCRIYLGRFVLHIIYTPEKQMFSMVYWNQPVSPSVRPCETDLIHNPLKE